MALLDRATNLHGPLSHETRSRIAQFLADPTPARWQDIHGIIVNAKSMRRGTVWQAVLAVDPTFPRSMQSETGWLRIPDPMLVARAIKAVLP